MRSDYVRQQDIDATEKAASAADAENDKVHAEALWKRAKFLRRRKREQDADMDGSAVLFMD